MPLIRKRSVDVEDYEEQDLCSSPKKRSRQSTDPPQTPGRTWSSTSPRKLPFPTPSKSPYTPYTPYTPYPFEPLDSPSNPFGRKCAESLVHSLPPVSSFSKHIPLRFQFVRTGRGSTISPRQGGTHRIVRVPKNYTFVHLRCLMAWLFNTPASYANGARGNDEYLFEVKEKVSMYSALYKPGQIKSGTTSVKLSNVRDPVRRWRARYGYGSEEDELSQDEEGETDKEGDGETQTGDEEESDDWKWADEEDFTLGHVYPQGLDAEIAVIYHHSPSTQVHITINKMLLPRQRGISNTPYVFTARGRVHLSPPPLPRPLFSNPLISSSPVAPRPSRGLRSNPVPIVQKPTSRGKARERHKPLVRLKSPTPPFHSIPNGRSKFKSTSTRLKSPPPPPREEDLTDADADGDSEEDNEGDLAPFDATHPFFHAEGSSPLKRIHDTKETILVEDSDNEDELQEEINAMLAEKSQDREVIYIDDSDEEEEEDILQEENHSEVLDPEKWNFPKAFWAFSRYFKVYMNIEPSTAPVLSQEEQKADPFDDDDDEVEVVKVKKVQQEDDEEERSWWQKREEQAEEDEYGDENDDEDMDQAIEIDLEEQSTDEDEDAEADLEEQDVEFEDEVEVEFDEEDEEEAFSQPIKPRLSSHIQSETSGSTPALTTRASSPGYASSLPPSSPPSNPRWSSLRSPQLASASSPQSHRRSSRDRLSSVSLPDLKEHTRRQIILSEHYPNKKYSHTPAPPKARDRRLRIERLERRLAKVKKGGFLTKFDEDQEEEEEKDQLQDDDGGEMGVDKSKQTEEEEPWTQPILAEGEVWDPFGDEEEI